MKLYMKIVGVDERISINQIRFDNRRMDDHQKPELFIRINKKNMKIIF